MTLQVPGAQPPLHTEALPLPDSPAHSPGYRCRLQIKGGQLQDTSCVYVQVSHHLYDYITSCRCLDWSEGPPASAWSAPVSSLCSRTLRCSTLEKSGNITYCAQGHSTLRAGGHQLRLGLGRPSLQSLDRLTEEDVAALDTVPGTSLLLRLLPHSDTEPVVPDYQVTH